MADNDTFRYLGGLGLEGFLAYMCDWVCTTWEETGPELPDLGLSWAVLGRAGRPGEALFRIIFGVIFGVLFWLLFGPLLAPKMAPKTDPKPLQNSTFLRSIFGFFFGRFWSSLGTFWEPSWAS